MDYYERKRIAQQLIVKLIDAKIGLEETQFQVEKTFQSRSKWTEKFYNNLKDRLPRPKKSKKSKKK